MTAAAAPSRLSMLGAILALLCIANNYVHSFAPKLPAMVPRTALAFDRILQLQAQNDNNGNKYGENMPHFKSENPSGSAGSVATISENSSVAPTTTVRKINELMVDVTDYVTIALSMFVAIGMCLNVSGYAYTISASPSSEQQEFIRIDKVENYHMEHQWKEENMRYEMEYMKKQAQEEL